MSVTLRCVAVRRGYDRIGRGARPIAVVSTERKSSAEGVTAAGSSVVVSSFGEQLFPVQDDLCVR
ncbi:hypothetical protein DEI83_15165 [Curtobacterium sp. MCBD17_021]|nr:hypothetical protein DEI83_15165 [Curtobacterium sp. MCBD17_021]